TDPQGRAGTFTYTLAAGGANIFNTGSVDSDCTVSGVDDLNQCRGSLTTTTTAPFNDTDTISNLVEHGMTWTLTEVDPGPDFSVESIDCMDSHGVSYHLFGTGQQTVNAFLIEGGSTTGCTIVNAF